MRSGFVVVAVAVVFARFAGWLLLLLFLVGGGGCSRGLLLFWCNLMTYVILILVKSV